GRPERRAAWRPRLRSHWRPPPKERHVPRFQSRCPATTGRSPPCSAAVWPPAPETYPPEAGPWSFLLLLRTYSPPGGKIANMVKKTGRVQPFFPSVPLSALPAHGPRNSGPVGGAELGSRGLSWPASELIIPGNHNTEQ